MQGAWESLVGMDGRGEKAAITRLPSQLLARVSKYGLTRVVLRVEAELNKVADVCEDGRRVEDELISRRSITQVNAWAEIAHLVLKADVDDVCRALHERGCGKGSGEERCNE